MARAETVSSLLVRSIFSEHDISYHYSFRHESRNWV